MGNVVENAGESRQNTVLTRLDEQQKWHSRKATHMKLWYRGLKGMEVVSAALIPFLSGAVTDVVWMGYLVGALGVLIVVLEGFQRIGQFHEQWESCRLTSERLEHERYLFLAGAGDYDLSGNLDDDATKLLAEHVEAIISSDNYRWSALMRHARKQPKPPTEAD